MKFFLSILAVLFFVWISFADVSDQRACVIGPSNCIHGGPIHVYDGSWSVIQGTAAKVSFDYDGYMFVLNNQGMVYRRYASGGWTYLGSVPGYIWDIDAHSDVLGPVVSTTSGVFVRSSTSGQWVIVASAGDLRAISCCGYEIYGLRLSGYVAKYINGSLAGLYAPPSGVIDMYDIGVSGSDNVYVSYKGPPNAPRGTIFKLDNMTSAWSTTANPATVFDVSLFTSDAGYDQAILNSSYDNDIWWCDKLDATNMINAGSGVENALDVAVGDGSYDIMSAPSRIMKLDGFVSKRDSVYTQNK